METIILVEDDDALREVTSRLLARNGYEVLAASSGPYAIETASGHPGEIHLLLTAVVMSRMLGTELAEHLRVLCPGIRVLYMSGYAQRVLVSHRTLDESVPLLEKPFTEHELLAKVREVLVGSSASVLPD